MTSDQFDVSDLVSELEQLQADMGSLQALFDFPEGDVTETDPEGVVSATVTPQLTVVALRVAPQWEQRVPAEQLAAAIDTALGRATGRAMGLNPDAEVPETLPAPQPTAADRAAVQRDLDETTRRFDDRTAQIARDPEAAGTAIEQMLAQLEGRLRAAEARPAEIGDTPEPQRFTSENHMVSMQSTGVGLAGTEINLNWLRGKSGTAVTQCLQEVLNQAPPPPEGAPSFRQVFGS